MGIGAKYRRILGVAGNEVLTTLLGLVSGILVARNLGADGRGAVTAVMVTLTVIGWLVFLGVPNAGGYLSTAGRSARSSASVIISTALGAVAGIVLWFATPAFASDYPQQVIDGLRCVAVLIPFVGIANCGQETLYAESRLTQWNILRSLPMTLPSVGILGLFLADSLTVRLASRSTSRRWWSTSWSGRGCSSIARGGPSASPTSAR